jgi:diguanylate cyclase (GGDEF)-like protein
MAMNDSLDSPTYIPGIPEGLLFDCAAIGLLGIDRRGRVRHSGRGADRLFDCPQGHLDGQPIERLLSGVSAERLNRTRPVVEVGDWAPEWLVDAERGEGVRANGSHFAVQISVARVVGAGDVHYLVLLVDLTAQLEHGDKLTRLAYRDTVTDLPNRAHFMRRLREAKAGRHDCSIALLFVDIDRFKEINDTIGHAGGDRALQIIGQRLMSAVRPQDIVARFGGDEFVVLMEEPGRPAVAGRIAERVAERILHALQKPVRLVDRGFRLSVSIGIAVGSEPTVAPDVLLDSADTAMYRVKQNGGGAYAHAVVSAKPHAGKDRHAG